MKPKTLQKRKYNAVYRLKHKIGSNAIPKRSKIIQPVENSEVIMQQSEAKILMSEYGFIIKLELF